MNLLITAGATREPLDAVRFLSNVSTGSTGAALADALAARDHRVILLRGESAVAPRSACEVEVFASAEDLGVRLQRRLEGGTFDAAIMCAAVADYRPDFAVNGKISSTESELALRLVRNPKILPQLKSFSPRPLTVIGFKLTVGADAAARRAAVAAQFAAGTVDAVVHNDLDEIRESAVHPFWLYRSATAEPERIDGTAALADALDRLVAAGVRIPKASSRAFEQAGPVAGVGDPGPASPRPATTEASVRVSDPTRVKKRRKTNSPPK